MADSVTQLRVAGPVGTKRNLAILGDGFAAADQVTYNNWVQTTLMDGVFGRDYFFEDASAWNIFICTKDGGATWNSASVKSFPKTLPLLASVSFANEMNGWAVGGLGHQHAHL